MGLLRVAAAEGEGALSPERKDERLRVAVPLRDVEGQLGPLRASLEVAEEPVVEPEPAGKERQLFARRLL